MTCAPVVVFAYNRPEHLRQTLAALAASAQASRTDVWLFSDGPKRPDVVAQVEAVRGVIAEVAAAQRFKSVQVVAAERNQGLANSIIGGVSRVLAGADCVIVLEDDLIVSPDFLEFMNDCLGFFRDDPSVGSITGSCPLRTLPPGTGSLLSVPRSCSHGWATWRDRWEQVDWEARDAVRLRRDARMRRGFDRAGADRFDRLLRQLDGKIDSWSIRFGLWHFMARKRTIYSAVNRVRNIGYDGSGVHCGVGEAMNDELVGAPVSWQLANPVEDPEIIAAFYRAYSGTWKSRVRRLIREVRLVVEAARA
jgi:hypothetical protein